MNPFASKFGGCDPWLDEDKGWPECKECELKKTFICQFVVQELPEAIRQETNNFMVKIQFDD